MKPVLQSRWKVAGKRLIYYGLRNYPHTYNNVIRISGKAARILKGMDGQRELSHYPKSLAINRLIKKGIVVDAKDKRKLPSSFGEARFCTRCVANDYIIPGLEFDGDGRCPLCQNFERDRKLTAFLPQIPDIKRGSGEYDIALFYTGGKDSSYMLYYLAKVLNLRVLALTWKMPYMSENALMSIENAKRMLPEVTFIIEEADRESLKKIYTEHFRLAGNACMCPSIAHILFYPMLVEKRVPYLALGNEPVQNKGLLYNQIAPRFTYLSAISGLLRFAVNAGRILTLRRPYRKGQFEMLTLVKGLSRGSLWGKNKYGRYQNESGQNVFAALRAAPESFMDEFKKAIKKSSPKNIPALIHIDFNATARGGVYKWDEVKGMIASKLGWVNTPSENKALHTSCRIERCKDYTQFVRFRKMESRTIPFSALEMPLAVLDGCITREDALSELKESSGFCVACPAEYDIMLDFFSN